VRPETKGSGESRWRAWLIFSVLSVPLVACAAVLGWPHFRAPKPALATHRSSANASSAAFDLRALAESAANRVTAADPALTSPTPRLLDVASSSGINFAYYPNVVPGRFFLPEDMGGGGAWFDLDGDGWQDLFLTNGCRLPLKKSDTSHVQQFYRQVAPGQFVEQSREVGCAFVCYGQGCTAGDIDNDGFCDLVVTALGSVVVILNNGDGTMNVDLENTRVQDEGWSTSAALGDLNRDGSLDLYVAHYAIVSLDDIPNCMYDTPAGKVRGYCGPASYVAEPHGVFMNRSNGAFDRLELTGDAAPKHPGKGLGVIIGDLDDDGWPETYVANDMDPSFLFHNLGNEPNQPPRLEEIAMAAGAAVSVDGIPEAGMGIACADFSGEKRLDIFITHYYLQKNTFYQNHGNLLFSDRSSATGLAAPSLPYLGFGTVPIDYDLDGWQDLLVANGHVLGKEVEPYAMRAQLFRNLGQARFVELTTRAGAYFFNPKVSRGVALADYDNDGDEDALIVHLDDQPVTLLRNDSDRVGQPIGIELVGTRSARSGIGARVLVHAGSESRMRMVLGGGSYLCASDLRILVGVPKNTPQVTIEVRWPSGESETWPDLTTGRYWRLVEGTSSSKPRFQPIVPLR
jgi:hypothetical protein